MTTTQQHTVPAHVETNSRLGTWIRVEDGIVLVHVGKVELGQGILTALHQIAADALGLPPERVHIRTARTDSGPDQGLTAGSMSVQESEPALRYVGAAVRQLAEATDTPLVEEVALRPVVPEEARDEPSRRTRNHVTAYVERIAELDPATNLAGLGVVGRAGPTLVVGTDLPRLDLPDKVLGRPRFVADLRPPGLLHGRVLRPPSVAATLRSLPDDWSAPRVDLVRDGSFLGVVGEREDDVDRALAALAGAAVWDEHDTLPDEDDLPGWLRAAASARAEVAGDDVPAPTRTASYSKPYLFHASIAPSCALAEWTADGSAVHVWSHSQGIHRLRVAIAAALGLDVEAVSLEHAENAGCYGHNGADDAALDAVLLARAVPGRPVLLRWSRADELGWGPLSPAMASTVSARLVDGRIDGWAYDVWSQGHASRPGYAGGHPGLLATAHVAGGTPLPAAIDPPGPGFGSLRNAVPGYDVGPRAITGHVVTEAPLRASAMRSLGAFFNVFAIESFVDELAADAGLDPVEVRLAHLTDPRARAVVERAAAESGWGSALPESGGRGIGFARYKNLGAYCAIVAEVEAGTELRVRRLTAAADLGLVINPDGARNQLSGGAVQATSWTTVERVRFDRRRITSNDWESYPILRFPAAPRVDVHLIDSDQPPLGAGECAQGPTAAAIANAVHAALGVRVRDLPLSSEAIVRAIEEAT